MVVIEKLTNFQYKDKNLRDHGENVRHRAKQLTELIMDPERVRSERKKVSFHCSSKFPRSLCTQHGTCGRGLLGNGVCRVTSSMIAPNIQLASLITALCRNSTRTPLTNKEGMSNLCRPAR